MLRVYDLEGRGLLAAVFNEVFFPARTERLSRDNGIALERRCLQRLREAPAPPLQVPFHEVDIISRLRWRVALQSAKTSQRLGMEKFPCRVISESVFPVNKTVMSTGFRCSGKPQLVPEPGIQHPDWAKRLRADPTIPPVCKRQVA